MASGLSDDNSSASSFDALIAVFSSSSSRCLLRAALLMLCVSVGVGGKRGGRAVGEKRRSDPGMTGKESSSEKKFAMFAMETERRTNVPIKIWCFEMCVVCCR